MVFDVEGVIIPKEQFLLFYVLRRISLAAFVGVALIGLLYTEGLLSIGNTVKRILALLKGFPVKKFISLFSKIPLMPEVESVFKEWRRQGFKRVLIGSGIPVIALKDLASRLVIDRSMNRLSSFEPELFSERGRAHDK